MMPADATLQVVTFSAELFYRRTDVERAIALLLSVVGRIESKAGCQGCAVTRDVADPNRVRYSEIWDSDVAFHRHLNSAEFRRVFMAMDLCKSEPRVLCGSLAGFEGMAYLRDIKDHSERESTAFNAPAPVRFAVAGGG